MDVLIAGTLFGLFTRLHWQKLNPHAHDTLSLNPQPRLLQFELGAENGRCLEPLFKMTLYCSTFNTLLILKERGLDSRSPFTVPCSLYGWESRRTNHQRTHPAPLPNNQSLAGLPNDAATTGGRNSSSGLTESCSAT